MKREIGPLRELMEVRKRELEDEQEINDIDDDARSIHVVEEDEDQLRAEEEHRRRRREELGRPRTPEPTRLGLTEDDYDVHHRDHGHGHGHEHVEQRSPSPPSHPRKVASSTNSRDGSLFCLIPIATYKQSTQGPEHHFRSGGQGVGARGTRASDRSRRSSSRLRQVQWRSASR
jgi:hypothetical protein